MMQGKNKVHQVLSFIVLITMGLVIMIPFMFMIVASFKESSEIFAYGLNLNLDFNTITLTNYRALFNNRSGIYWRWFFNSVLITSLTTAFVLLFSSMVGYGLARYQFNGRNLIFILVLAMLMVPRDILLLPLYRLMVQLRLMDTYIGVVLPGMVPPATVFFFRQFCTGLERDYAEAARIDGCGEARIFWQIYVPLMKPAFGAMTILTAMNAWNDFLWPLIVLRSTENFTLPAGLMSAMTPYGNNYDLLFAGSVMSIVPIVILFLYNQKSFIDGLTIGGVKG